MVTLNDKNESKDQEASCSESDTRLAVCLSGGGVRAAFFSFGVLLYLVRSRANEMVCQVISVSGGSVPNAAAATIGNFSGVTTEEFEASIGPLAAQLSEQGAFFLPRLANQLRVLVVGAILFAAGFATTFWALGGGTDLVVIAVIVFSFLGGGFLMILLRILFRARLQGRVFGKLLDQVLDGKRPKELGTLPESSVRHVFCATDLESGQPFYFMREWVFSPWLGWSKPGDFTLEKAVYASAAFPLVLPPLKLNLSAFEFTGGAVGGDRPRKIRLADGGVYNNLGNDYPEHVAQEMDRPWATAGDSRFAGSPVNQLLVVNASSPPQPKKRLFSKYLRTFVVTYENTVRPRLGLLNKQESFGTLPIVVSLEATPDAVAARSAQTFDTDDPGRDRGETLESRLSRVPPGFWTRLADQATSVKTTFDPIGQERAARLMQHGYYSAMAALHTHLGCEASLPKERYFQDLVKARNDSTKGGTDDAADLIVESEHRIAPVGSRPHAETPRRDPTQGRAVPSVDIAAG